MPFFRQALDLGITFWDTANGYNAGTSEEAVGRALKEFTRRDDIVVATKVFLPVHDGPGGSGLSRKAIMEQIDDSLTRLGPRNCPPDALNLVGEREPAWSGFAGLPQPRARRRPRPGNSPLTCSTQASGQSGAEPKWLHLYACELRCRPADTPRGQDERRPNARYAIGPTG